MRRPPPPDPLRIHFCMGRQNAHILQTVKVFSFSNCIIILLCKNARLRHRPWLFLRIWHRHQTPRVPPSIFGEFPSVFNPRLVRFSPFFRYFGWRLVDVRFISTVFSPFSIHPLHLFPRHLRHIVAHDRH